MHGDSSRRRRLSVWKGGGGREKKNEPGGNNVRISTRGCARACTHTWMRGDMHACRARGSAGDSGETGLSTTELPAKSQGGDVANVALPASGVVQDAVQG